MASKEFCRPDPDELLRQIHAHETRAKRGRLKIFLGYAPRVGKSIRMFDEGLRRLKRGQDVVVGAIQTKGSQHLETMLSKVELIPSLVVGGSEAVDVAAVLKRFPQVCLIDELARENPPGACNKHRWQDVEEILAAGINVVGAINLQHVSEEQDAVERITGRRAVNSVPAGFIQSADELVLVDVPAEEVARPGERGNLASSLSSSQLSELRELALLLAAQVVEEQLQRYMEAHGIRQSWSTQERILVCITPRSSARVMTDSAARATQRFHGQMLAVYVKQGELQRAEEEALQENLDYARKLGAEVHVLEGADAIARILQFAHEERITQLFIGHTQRKSWAFWAENPVDRLIKAADGIDVRLFPQAHTA
jgi:two-component system sensor histidine kinase KdpD